MILTREGLAAAGPKSTFSRINQPPGNRTFRGDHLREKVNGSTRWWSVVAFDEASIAAVLSMKVGDPIAVSGEFDCELWTPEGGGESRLSWKITADAVLSTRAKPKKAKLQDSRQPLETKRWEGGPNDGVPF